MIRTTAAALTAAVALAAPAAAAPGTDLQPQRLDRGPDVALAHVEDGTFVDGTRRVALPGNAGEVLGASGDAWVVSTWRENAVGERLRARVVRLEADGSIRTLARGAEAYAPVLAEDGSRLVTTSGPSRRATVTVRSAADGTEVASRRFTGYPEVVTADARRVLVDTTARLADWRPARDRVRTLTTRLTGLASIEHDLLETYSRDPYLGGCTRLVRLSAPDAVEWRSCRDRVAALSPDGEEMLTFGILTDGLGPGEITLRSTTGVRKASWRTGWFGDWRWESPGTVLLGVNGRRLAATVRCTVDACENATDPVPTEAP